MLRLGHLLCSRDPFECWVSLYVLPYFYDLRPEGDVMGLVAKGFSLYIQF